MNAPFHLIQKPTLRYCIAIQGFLECRHAAGLADLRRAARIQIFSIMEKIMGKAQDTKKTVKKEPAKTPKEKKAAKKVKKEEKKHQ